MMRKMSPLVLRISEEITRMGSQMLREARNRYGVRQAGLARALTEMGVPMSISGVSRMEERGPVKLARGLAMLAIWVRAMGGTEEDFRSFLLGMADQAWAMSGSLPDRDGGSEP